MRVKTVPSSWIDKNGYRFDCNPYMSGAIEARVILENISCDKQFLNELTLGGDEGIYHAGREGRTWVASEEHGVPFLGSSDILKADLSGLKFIANRQVRKTPAFIIRRGWTLITRSGTIGRMLFSRTDMDGMACSEHVMRVLPDTKKVPAGYLYAYLNSKFGVPLVISGTYGSIIQSIEPHHVSNIPVPRLNKDIELEINDLVERAQSLRCLAIKKLIKTEELLKKFISGPDFNKHKIDTQSKGASISSQQIKSTYRLEGYYYNPRAQLIDLWIQDSGVKFKTLGEVANVEDVPPFKHIYVDGKNGTPFFTSGELFKLDRTPEKYLSNTQTKSLHKYIIRKGTVLLARSGQLGGIIGKPQYTDSYLDNSSTSDHVIRVTPRDSEVLSGYLYAYLASKDIGYPLITRTICGKSVPALWPVQLTNIPIVLIDPNIMSQIHELVESAFEARVKATEYEHRAVNILEVSIENLVSI